MLMIRVCLVAGSLSARIFDLASVCARWVTTRGWMLLGAAALCIALPGLMPMPGGSAHAGIGLEERKLPMKFSWVACPPNCQGWFGQRLVRARTALAQSRGADHRRHQRPEPQRPGRPRQRHARSILRVQ